MRLTRLLRTSSFRLTLLYAGFFSASVIILFAVIYWATSVYMKDQLDASIDSDVTELEDGFRTGGADRVAELIRERVGQMPNGPILYLLEDADGAPIAGNLPPAAAKEHRLDIEVPSGLPSGPHRRVVHAHGVGLPDGHYLVVGADAQPLRDMRRLILRAFGWSFGITLLLAFLGGAVMSGRLLNRVEAIGRTAREIMAGELSRRVPIRGADDEFDHLAASLNAMLDRTEAALEGMRQVSNDIAHDLRTPLARLRQRLELAQRRARTADELREAIDRSIVETDAILETFGALLRIAQIESGNRKASFAEVDLSELLQTLVEVYQPSADERSQSLVGDPAPGLTVRGDRELLAQMFANLIENALRHSPNGASVSLAVHSAAEEIVVVIADDGPGIPMAQRSNVFRRFYRLEASRTTPGNGLGLSLVAAVAALHDATLELADNAPGLRVTLRLGSVRDGGVTGSS